MEQEIKYNEKNKEIFLGSYSILKKAAQNDIYPATEEIKELAKIWKLQIKPKELNGKKPINGKDVHDISNGTKPSFLSMIFGIEKISKEEIRSQNKKNTKQAMQNLILGGKNGIKVQSNDEKKLFEVWGYQIRRKIPHKKILKEMEISLITKANAAFEDNGHKKKLSKTEYKDLKSKIDSIVATCFDPKKKWNSIKELLSEKDINVFDESAGEIIKKSLIKSLGQVNPQRDVIDKIKKDLIPVTIKLMLLKKFPGKIGGGEFALLGDLKLRKQIAQKLLEITRLYADYIFVISENNPCYEYIFNAIKFINWDKNDQSNYCFDFNESSNEQAVGLKKILRIIIEETDKLIEKESLDTQEIRDCLSKLNVLACEEE